VRGGVDAPGPSTLGRGTARVGNSRRQRSSISHSGVCCWIDRVGSGGYAKTADPSTALRFGRDDKGRGGCFRKICDWDRQSESRGYAKSESRGYAKTADPSTALRSGRDDKGRGDCFRKVCHWDRQSEFVGTRQLQIPPLRFAPVGMTRGEGVVSGRSAIGIDRVKVVGTRRLQIPPLRFAPVGMTRGEGIVSGKSAIGIDRVRVVGTRRNRRSLHCASLRSRRQSCGIHRSFFARGLRSAA
jgi:hypothetical protein